MRRTFQHDHDPKHKIHRGTARAEEEEEIGGFYGMNLSKPRSESKLKCCGLDLKHMETVKADIRDCQTAVL